MYRPRQVSFVHIIPGRRNIAAGVWTFLLCFARTNIARGGGVCIAGTCHTVVQRCCVSHSAILSVYSIRLLYNVAESVRSR